jgi:hypothetical protein
LVATLAVVLVAVGLFAVARGQVRPDGSPAPTTAAGTLSPLDEALKGIRDDGTWSKETALAVFAAAFGPLPGVPDPRPDSSYRSGSLAIRMVQAYWSELTDAQKQAIRDYVGPAAATALPAAFRPEFAALQDTYQQMVDEDVADVATRFGRPLGFPIPVILGGSENGKAWAWATGIWPIGQRASACTMTVPPSTINDPTRQEFLRWVFMHEVWHCFEYTMIDYTTHMANPPWVTEGEANWVAEAITGGTGAPPPAIFHWGLYITDPGKPLYGREYDGMGFFAQLARNGIDPWTVLEPVIRAGGNDAALQASGANTSTFMDRWGSSWFRDPQPTTDWAMGDGYGIPPVATHAVPSTISLADGGEESFEAKPVSAKIVFLHTTAFVTRVQVPTGTGRVGEVKSGGLDKVVRGATLDLCTNPNGDCTCPPGSSPLTETPPVRASPELRLAATGEQHTTSIVQLRGISKNQWCTPKATPAPEKPCKEGCGGSNGDPHLRTVDGFRYDLQAAGEFVLLRAPDGSVEIQGRQERPSEGSNATIGTAVAVKVNGHRVGFYTVASGPPEVHVDGVVVDAAKATSADLGAGTKLAAYQRGYELDLPDGTKVWALSIGRWGINLLVLPSASLRSSGVGLIGHVDAGSRLKVPSPPDGSTFAKPADAHERYHDLYEVLAPGWRVTAASSLFDYAAGKATDSYTLAGFPPEAVAQSIDDLDAAAVLRARSTCASVTDPDLLDECAYDVAVTGSTEYATLYASTEALETQGVASLDQPPPSASSPPPVVGTPSGINLVEDHLVGVGSSVLGPDGTLYVYVAEQGAGLGDFKPVLLAVDSATGKVKHKAGAAAAVGALAWGDGSLWAGEFERSDAVFCEISRLDPVTLAVQAKVPTVCSTRGRTDFGTVGDAVWFADGTGVDANGGGGHLRRIDPTTNKVDPTASGNLDLPVTPQAVGIPGGGSILASTSKGIVVGDRQHGFYVLTVGSDAFEKIDLPAGASKLFPAGDGIWTQTEIGTSSAPEGVVTFATTAGGSGAELGIDGDLVGADDSAVYATPPKEDQDPDAIWRYPIEGGAPARLAVTGQVPNGFGGTLTLIYRDPGLPLLAGNHLIVKLWQTASAGADVGVSLVIQAIPVP